MRVRYLYSLYVYAKFVWWIFWGISDTNTLYAIAPPPVGMKHIVKQLASVPFETLSNFLINGAPFKRIYCPYYRFIFFFKTLDVKMYKILTLQNELFPYCRM